jgi:hypothetical protein
MSKGGKYQSMVEPQIHMTLGSFITAMKIDGRCNCEVNFRR